MNNNEINVFKPNRTITRYNAELQDELAAAYGVWARNATGILAQAGNTFHHLAALT
jgi:hypothetical protein